MSIGRARDEDGVVLLLVLAIITVTISVVYAFARTSLLEVASAKQRIALTRATMLARSGLPIAVRVLVDDVTLGQGEISHAIESARDPWMLLGREPIEAADGGELWITVRDAGGRININGLVDAEGVPYAEESRAFLTAALERIIEYMPGRVEEKRYEPDALADAILDWIDSDDQTRLGDSEAADYATGDAGGPRDGPIYSLEALASIPDMDRPLLNALADYFTTYPPLPGGGPGTGVNPNTAPAHVLGLIYHGTSSEMRLLGQDEVFAVLRARSEGQIFCPGREEEPCVSFDSEIIGEVGETVFPSLAYRSHVFEIRSEGRYGDVRSCATAIIDRSDPRQLMTLSYRLEC